MAAAARTAAALADLIALAARRAGIPDPAALHAGQFAVELIVAEYGGRRLYIPMHEMARRARDDAIRRNLEAGMSPSRLARRYGVSRGRIRQIGRAVGKRADASGG